MGSGHDPYAYPGTDVLANKAGIRDAERLREFEYRKVVERELELQDAPIRGKFDLGHLQAIHKHLFQDVYAWAGQIRTVGITKENSTFAMPEQIESYGRKVFADIAKDNYLKGLDKQTFAERAAYHFSEQNALHAFREGNGRSTRVFMSHLAREAGYDLDYRKVEAKEWNDMARRSFAGDLRPAVDVFSRIATPMRAVAFETEPRESALRKHPELKGAFDTLDEAGAYIATRAPRGEIRDSFMAETRDRLRQALERGEIVQSPNKDQQRPRPSLER
jgi:cell filamentation protein